MESDGLSDMVRDIGIAEVMLASTSLEQKAKQLIAEVLPDPLRR